jgi:Lipid A 3-O-deacylase (PagL)
LKIKIGMLLLLASIWLQFADAWSMGLEVGGGSTFNRHPSLHNTPIINLNLISQADSRFPTEWSFGYLLPQDKNPSGRGNNDAPVIWFGISKRLRWKALFAGFGLVVIDRTTQDMSTHVNFKSEAGFQLGPVVTMLQHISNAGLHGMNDGEDMVNICYRFSFGN